MKELTAALNLDHEVAAMAEFISQKWTPIAGIEALFHEIRDAALHDARAWLDHYLVSDCVHELITTREALLAPTVQMATIYDAVCMFLSDACMNANRIADAGRDIDGQWDFSRKADRVYYQMVAKYPDLAKARPHGWEALEKGYSDFDGQEEYEPGPDRELFKGTSVTSAGAPQFPSAVALPYVMYDEKCQGRKAPRVLVAAVYSQFLGIISFLNANRACTALRQIRNLAEPTIQFEVLLESEDPLVKALRSLASEPVARVEYEESLARKAAFAALPVAEQEVITAANRARIAAEMKEMFSRKPDPEADAREAVRKEKLTAAVREAFGN